jgi:hypothetical protein
MSLKLAKDCLQRKRFTEAIALLEAYCKEHPDPQAPDYYQAQMWLVTAWHRSGRPDKAKEVCGQLVDTADLATRDWAKRYMTVLQKELGEFVAPAPSAPQGAAVVVGQANRYRRRNVVLTPNKHDRLVFMVTMVLTLIVFLSLILGFWLFLVTRFVLIVTAGWWTVLAFLTLITAVLFFFMAPWLIDITQKRYQQVQWITWGELEFRTPETVELVQFFVMLEVRIFPALVGLRHPSPLPFAMGFYLIPCGSW